MLKQIHCIIIMIIFTMTLICCSGNYDSNYIATNKWVAEFVKVAGVENIKSLINLYISDSSKYELNTDDLNILSKAKIIFYSEYDGELINKITKMLNQQANEIKFIQIKTEITIGNIKEQTMKIAQEIGNNEKCEKNLIQIEKVFSDFISLIKKKGFDQKSVYVNIAHLYFVKSLGLNIIGTFGPEPVSAGQIKDVENLRPDVIIDNQYNKVGGPLKEIHPEAMYISFINYPNGLETKSIEDVILYNQSILINSKPKE